MMTIVYFTDIYRNGMVFLPLFIHHSLYFNPLFSSFAIHAASSKVIFVFCAIVDAVGCCIFNVSHAEFNSRHVFQRRQTFFGSWNRVQSFRHVLQCWFAMLFKQLNKRKKNMKFTWKCVLKRTLFMLTFARIAIEIHKFPSYTKDIMETTLTKALHWNMFRFIESIIFHCRQFVWSQQKQQHLLLASFESWKALLYDYFFFA